MNTLYSTLKLRIVSQEPNYINIEIYVHLKYLFPPQTFFFFTLVHEYLKYVRLPDFIRTEY